MSDTIMRDDNGRGACRICGCTESQSCMTTQGPCYWINLPRHGQPGLCSACTRSSTERRHG